MADDSKPVYLRLREIIAASILDGEYRDGALLPSVRAFAAQQGANPLTVAKAYQSFQDDGLVVVKRGVGLFLAEGATERLLISEREHFLSCYWPKISAMIDRLGLDRADLMAKPAARSSGDETSVAA